MDNLLQKLDSLKLENKENVSAVVLNGKSIADDFLKDEKNLVPENHKVRLVIINTDDNKASLTYIKMKVRKFEELGFEVQVITDNGRVPMQYDGLSQLIDKLNNEDDTDGIIVQLPLRENLRQYQRQILNSIHPSKDVDGLTLYNQGLVMNGSEESHVSCTPKGVIKMLDTIPNMKYEGKVAVVVGRSNLFGKPMCQLDYK